MVKYFIDKRRCSVRDHQLQEQTPQDQEYRFVPFVFVVCMPFLQLYVQLFIPGYGALDDLREPADEQQEAQWILRNLRLSPVQVSQPGNQLHAVERNAQRDNDGPCRQDLDQDQRQRGYCYAAEQHGTGMVLLHQKTAAIAHYHMYKEKQQHCR